MRNIYLRLVLSIAVTFCLIFLSSQISAASESSNLTISPSIESIQIEKGESQEREITVVNNSSEPAAIKVYAENFEAADIYGGISFNTDTQPEYSSSAWIKFPTSSLLLESRQTTKLKYIINCPEIAESGGHYSAVFFEPVSAASITDSSSLGVTQRMGALLYITVGGDKRVEGQVLGASTDSKCVGLKCSFKTDSFREWGPVPFEFQYQNTGNVHVKVAGKIDIYNLYGKKLAEVPVESKTVLPDSARLFKATWLREPLFGPYRAVLTLSYGVEGRTASAETTFWAVPWRFMLVVVLLLALLILFVFRKSIQKRWLHNFIAQTKQKK